MRPSSLIKPSQYCPFGVQFVSQKLNTGVRFTFSGKERDSETDYSYFGARYYTSDLGVWLSVDRLAKKYPSFSSYNFSLNNPINLVDPNGDSVLAIFDSQANVMFMVDYDHYKKGLPTVYVGPDDYEVGGVYDKDGNLAVNQVLIVEGVFTGGQSDYSGNITYGNTPEQIPAPSTTYEILADTDDPGQFRIDALDSRPRNDQYDNNTYRNSEGGPRAHMRLHDGSLSHGCVTVNNKNSQALKGWTVIESILNSTTSSQVRDRYGRLNRWGLRNTQVTRYGSLIIR